MAGQQDQLRKTDRRRSKIRPFLSAALIGILLILSTLSPFGEAYAQSPSEEVRAAQQALKEFGFDPGPADGLMGHRTHSAIGAFQRSFGLGATGQLDPITLQALGVLPAAPDGQTAASPQRLVAPPVTTTTQRASLATSPAGTARPRNVGDGTERGSGQASSSTESTDGSSGWIGIVAIIVFLLWWSGRRQRRREERKKQEAIRRMATSDDLAPLEVTSRPDPARSATPGPGIGAKLWATSDGRQVNARLHAETVKRGSEQCWVPKGCMVTVAGRPINDGMIYVGSDLARQDGFGVDNCLIDPNLEVAKSAANTDGTGVPYYPSYSRLDPASRRAYFDWLVGGKSDPSAYIGYVFLYFYGLERRLMLDRSEVERTILTVEVERLRGIYAQNGSFDRYSRLLLDAAAMIAPTRKFYEETAPLERTGWEVPLIVKLAIGQLVAEGRPVPADWMLAWAMTDPATRLRTPAQRARYEFVQLFRLRFVQKYPDGLPIKPPKPRLNVTYRAASGSFQVNLNAAAHGLPDIGGLTGPLNKAREIAEVCTAELDAYSRFLGRHGDARNSFQAMALLPRELAEKIESGAARDLRGVLDRILSDGPRLMPAHEVIEKVAGAAGAQAGKIALQSCADTLKYFGVGLAPDPRTALQLPKADQPVALFKLPADGTGSTNSEAYRNALLFLSFAAYVAHANSAVSPAERDWLDGFVKKAPDLDEGERQRLSANLQWLLAVPPALGVLRSRLAPLPTADRQELGRIALAVACSDANVDPSEIKALQRVYKLLGLDDTRVFHDVHALMAGTAGADEPVPIQIGQPAPNGYTIPKRLATKPTEGIRLDPDRIRQISENTERVSAILAKVFVSDEPEEAAPGIEAETEVTGSGIEHDRGVFDGLERRYGSFLAELLTRADWSGEDLSALARSFGLMADGAIEVVNEWAFDRYGDALIEDGDPMIVNETVCQQIRAVEAAHA